jgi:hypothetical protein
LNRYKKQQALSGKEIEVKNITASDYSVWVQDLPCDATEEEVEAWLRAYGDIHSVLLSRSNANVISLLHEKHELQEEFQHCSALQQLGTNIQEARKQLATLRRRLDAIADEIDASRDRSYLYVTPIPQCFFVTSCTGAAGTPSSPSRSRAALASASSTTRRTPGGGVR